MSGTWTCHVCKDERPDAAISVVSTDLSKQYGLPPGTMKQNVRYCNDRPECAENGVRFGKDRQLALDARETLPEKEPK